MGDRPTLSVAFVPGVTVTKWTRIWAERHPQIPLTAIPVDQREQVSVVLEGSAMLSFVRLPIDSERLHVIPLYQENTVAVAAKDHFIAAASEITLADLAGENLTTAGTAHHDRVPFDVVAAGVGVLVVPQAIARLQSRKDVVVRPIRDAPETQIALVWRVDPASDTGSGENGAALIDEFIGIVRGRTARSSRSASPGDGSTTTKQPGKGTTPAKRAVKGVGAAHAASRKRGDARKKHRGR